MNILVLHVIDSLASGGAERMLVEYTNELQRQGIQVGVCVTRGNSELAKELLPDIKLFILDRKSTWELKGIYTVLKICRDYDVRILHAHGRSSVMFCSLIKGLYRRRLKLVFHDHYGKVEVDDKASLSLQLICRLFVDFYIAVDPLLQKWAVKKLGIAPKNTEVIENALNLQRFTTNGTNQLLKLDHPHQLLGVIIANLRSQKDHPLLIKALAKTKKAREQLDIFVVGKDFQDEYSRYCHQLVTDLGLDNNIYFLGSRDDIVDILHIADIGLLSSISESGPLSLIEYMACGLPFLVTKTGSIARKVYERLPEFFVQPGDTLSFALALDRMVELDLLERKEIGNRNKKIATLLFSITEMTTNLKNIYTCLLSSNEIPRIKQ